MKNYSTKAKIAFFSLATAGLFSAAFPLLTGAAPTQAPPDGLITPTFSGLKINNGAVNNLNVNSSGEFSNQAVNQPIKFVDNDGIYFSTANARGTVAFFPSEAQSYWRNIGNINNTLVGQSFNIHDSHGLVVAEDSGANPVLKVVPLQTVGTLVPRGIYANAPISNSGADGGGSVIINDLDGFKIQDGWGSTVFQVNANGQISNPSTTPSSVPGRPPVGNSVVLQDNLNLSGSLSATGNVVAPNLYSEYNIYAGTGFAGDTLYTRNLLGGGTIAVKAGLAAEGKVTSTSGFGTYVKRNGAALTVAAGSNGTAYAYCNSGEQLVSCGYWNGHWNVVPAVLEMEPGSNRCRVAAANPNGVASSITARAMCLNPNN